MYELVKITDNNYYVNSPTKVGIYESAPGEVWLIDSGSDKDAARKIWKHVTEQGWSVKGILATHSHADHIGGAKTIMERSGCKIYANSKECAFVCNTVLEPATLYGGYPPNVLRNKFLVAPAVPCSDISEADLPAGLQLYDLPGHAVEMLGVLTPEGVFYCGDVVSSAATLEKYHINYLYDVRAALDCLAGLPQVKANWYLPAHAELTTDIAPLAQLNLDKMQEIIALLKGFCAAPAGFEDILQRLFDHYGLTLDWSQYVLSGSTVRSYLAYLLDAGEMETKIVGNKLLWQSL